MARHPSRNSFPVPGPERWAGEQRGTTVPRNSRAVARLFLKSYVWREHERIRHGGSHESGPCIVHYLRWHLLPGDSGSIAEPCASGAAKRHGFTGQWSTDAGETPGSGKGCRHSLPDGIAGRAGCLARGRSEEHTSELQSPCNLVCRLLLEKKNRQ